jgi:LacI family transcriptional regulator
MEGKAQGWEVFNRELEEWIDTWEPPIGIAVCRDLYCRYLIDACRRKGLNVSQDVALVGRGNEPIICNSPSPTLTSIDMGHEQIGYKAARLLEQMMNGEEVTSEQILLPPSELIPRQSSDAFAAEDPLVAKAMRYIAENCDNPIKVDDVCKAIATSRRTLERKFRDSVDRSIAQEITRLRIESAKRRLIYSDAALKSIAMDSGFRNSDQFYKVFQRVEGMPPSKFRESYQKV